MRRFGELIAPVTPAEFFASYWERRPLVTAARDRGRFAGLFSFDEADRILTAGARDYPSIRLARGEERLDPAEFTFGSGRIDPVAVTKLFADGATIVLDQLQETVPALRSLCRDLESELGTAFHTNIYVTPPHAQGFKVHYDTHDVFILQVAGAKEWEAFESPIALPLSGQGHDEDGRVPGESLARFRLEAGDLAYLPRGLYHKAVSDAETSIHITLGVVERNWCSLMLEAVAEASLREEQFRRALPIGFGLSGFDYSAAEAEFRRLFDLLVTRVDFAAAAASINQAAVRGQRGAVEGQLREVANLQLLNDSTTLVARQQNVLAVDSADGAVTIEAPSVGVTFPRAARPAVEALLSGRVVRLGDIPGLDAAGRITLARRMILEGLIVVERYGADGGTAVAGEVANDADGAVALAAQSICVE